MSACVHVGMIISVHESVSVIINHTLQCFCRVLPWEAPLRCFQNFLLGLGVNGSVLLSVIVNESVIVRVIVSVHLSVSVCQFESQYWYKYQC